MVARETPEKRVLRFNPRPTHIQGQVHLEKYLAMSGFEGFEVVSLTFVEGEESLRSRRMEEFILQHKSLD